jgi:hypothetical protein
MQWFDAIDKDGNNELTAVELQAALQLGNLNFSLATVAHIIRIHDKTGSSTINFEEFGKLHEFLTNVQQRCVCLLAAGPAGLGCSCCTLDLGSSTTAQSWHALPCMDV